MSELYSTYKTEVMCVLVSVVLIALSLLLKQRLRDPGLDKVQNTFEMFMEQLCSLIREIVRKAPEPYVPLVGTLFLFVFFSNLLGMFPGLESPTGNLSVAAGLAVIVFLAVPFYGIRAKGARAYFRSYLKPNPFMLPFNLLGELTRTLALAVRLFGNIMSGQFLFLIIAGVITTLLVGYRTVFIPFGFALTLFISVLSLITAVIQAYIFTVLALVYIGAAVESSASQAEPNGAKAEEGAS